MENPSEENPADSSDSVPATAQQNGQEAPKSGGSGVAAEDGGNYNPEKLPDELRESFLVDAIGDTLYSKRFVLTTLLNLNKVEAKLSEEFEKDLCTLWDMTIEKDVIKLLMEHNVLEIFSEIIQMSEDQRLVEILLGIIGNMCALAETREALCQQSDVMIPIIDLVSCSDSMILIQLMRLFHTCLVFENSDDEYIWFHHFRCSDQFVDKFAFILSNSMSTTLLLASYEALNAICTKFTIIEIQPEILDSSGFRNVFVKPALVHGVIEAFKQMMPDARGAANTSNDGENSQSNCSAIEDDISAPTKRTQRITNLFLDINVILSQYEQYSHQCYAPFMDELLKCVVKCLAPMCTPIYLLPLTSNEQILIESVNELIQALDDPFDARCFGQMVKVWSLIDDHLAQSAAQDSEWDQINAEEEEVSGVDVNMTILEFLTRTSKNATVGGIVEGLAESSASVVSSVYKALSAGDAEDDIKACCDKLREAAKKLWNIELVADETNGFSDLSGSEHCEGRETPNPEGNANAAENMTTEDS